MRINTLSNITFTNSQPLRNEYDVKKLKEEEKQEELKQEQFKEWLKELKKEISGESKETWAKDEFIYRGDNKNKGFQ